MRLLFAGGIALLLTAGLIKLTLSMPRLRNRLVTAPVSDRWHKEPTPSFGGVPMFVAVAVAVVGTGGLGDDVARAILAGAAILFVLGLVDDLYDISPMLKLAGQLVAATLVAIMTGGTVGLTLLLGAAAIAWMVLMTNSVNLIDNMDGLAGSVGLAASALMLPLVISAGQDGLALVSVAVGGALAGFLVFNLSPARVFMGDTGSLWLGLVLAAITAFVDSDNLGVTVVVAATVLAVPLLDTATVSVSRVRSGRSIMRGGKDHISHRLVRLGLTDRQSVRALTSVTLLAGLAAISHIFVTTLVWLMVIGIVWLTLLVLTAALLRIPVYQREGDVSQIVPETHQG